MESEYRDKRAWCSKRALNINFPDGDQISRRKTTAFATNPSKFKVLQPLHFALTPSLPAANLLTHQHQDILRQIQTHIDFRTRKP